MRRGRLLAVAGAAAAAAAGAWLVLAPAGAREPDPARGAAIYAEACAACHGAELEGDPDWRRPLPDGRLRAPPHDASGHTWHHPDRVLFEITKHGSAQVIGGGYESDMIGFGDVYSDEEIEDVLAFIKSSWPERERAHQARLTQQDEALR